MNHIQTVHLPGAGDGRPPLLFIHGSFAAAWVWQRHMMPYFAERGWECLALSFRGHGASDGADRLDHFGLHHYVEDVAQAAAMLDRPPVLVGHSLGGAVAQLYASRHDSAGQILLASALPGGLAASTWWMMLRHPGFAWQISLLESFGEKHIDPDVLSRHLFSDQMPRDEALAFLPLLHRESRRAVAEIMLPQRVWRPRPDYPTLVIGGHDDVFITQAALHATAAFWHARLLIMRDLPHVMMLDPHWRRCAEAMEGWLVEKFPR